MNDLYSNPPFVPVTCPEGEFDDCFNDFDFAAVFERLNEVSSNVNNSNVIEFLNGDNVGGFSMHARADAINVNVPVSFPDALVGGTALITLTPDVHMVASLLEHPKLYTKTEYYDDMVDTVDQFLTEVKRELGYDISVSTIKKADKGFDVTFNINEVPVTVKSKATISLEDGNHYMKYFKEVLGNPLNM